jgi:hypothetical protein
MLTEEEVGKEGEPRGRGGSRCSAIPAHRGLHLPELRLPPRCRHEAFGEEDAGTRPLGRRRWGRREALGVEEARRQR